MAVFFMRRLSLTAALILHVLGFTLRHPAYAAESAPARMRLPWQDLKALLNIDHDRVRLSWDEFRRILAAMPAGERPHYQTQGGDVLLSRAEFSRLLQQL